MLENIASADIARVIQLSVAPVFLLASIGSILGVLAGRLARIVDSARVLETRYATATEPTVSFNLRGRLVTLALRARLIGRAMTLCTLTAVLICAVVITLFLGAIFSVHTAIPAAMMFIAALLSFAAGLILFLREVFLAMSTLKIGPAELKSGEPA